MSLIEKIPDLSDASLKNLLDNARRLETSGTVKQRADATELLPALEAAFAARRTIKLEAAAEKRGATRKVAAPKAPRKTKAKVAVEA